MNNSLSFFYRSKSFFRYFVFVICLFVTVSELFCCEFFETFEILSEILLPIKSPVASAVFQITLFEEV